MAAMLQEIDFDALVAACQSADEQGLRDASSRLGFVVTKATAKTLEGILDRTRRQGYSDPEITLQHPLQAAMGAVEDPSGVSLLPVPRGFAFGKDYCLAVRLADRVVVGVGHATNTPLPVGAVWPELKPWYKDLHKNRERAEKWASKKRALDRTSFALVQRPVAVAVGSSAAPVTEADLMRMVLAAPDDDGPRLVLADWLHERGDVRGELIQMQCAAAHMKFGDPGLKELQERIRVLMTKYGDQMAGEAARIVDGYKLERGLVGTVVMKPATFRRHGERLLQAYPIETLSPQPLLGDALAKLASCSGLRLVRRLQLDSPIDHRERVLPLQDLAGGDFSALREIRMTNIKSHAEGWRGFFSALRAPRLEFLDFFLGQLRPHALAGLGENPHVRALKQIKMWFSFDRGVSGDEDARLAAFRALGRAAAFQALNEVSLGGWPGVTEEHVVEWFGGPNVKSLQRVSIDCRSRLDAGAAAIARSSDVGSLRRIQLEDVGRRGVEAMLRSPNLRSLETLEWRGTEPDETRSLLEMALSLPTSHPLSSLRFDRAEISEEVLQRVSARFQLL